MKKQLCISVIFVVLTSSLSAQKLYHYKDSTISVAYHTDHGKLNGTYTSYYPSGEKMTEGKFYHNQRIGMWNILSEDGDTLVSREYSNNFVFFNEGEMVNELPYVPYRNTEDLFEFFPLKEENVLFLKRYFSLILPESNEYLFVKSDAFLNLLISHQKEDEFQRIDIYRKYKKKPIHIPTVENAEIIAFKLWEEAVYDDQRQIMERRIVFVCPVIQNKTSGKIYDQNWLYFDAIYPFMRNILLEVLDPQMEIFSMADVFFWRYLKVDIINNRQTVMNSNEKMKDVDSEVFDGNSINPEVQSKSADYLIQLLESEHELWLKN